jgi:hypothetical protein
MESGVDMPEQKIRGVNIPCYKFVDGHETTLGDFRWAYDDLQEVGGNAVALNDLSYFYIHDGSVVIARPPESFGTSKVIWRHGSLSIGLDLLRAAVIEAKSRGLYVMLKPMIDCYYPRGVGGWRGYASAKGLGYDMSGPLFWAYRDFLRPHLTIAKEEGVEAVCLGTELYTVTKEFGGDLVRVAATYARNQGYDGTLVYAANWGVGADAEFERLRAVEALHGVVEGVDAYFPLAAAGVPVDEHYEQAVFDGWARWEDALPPGWVGTEVGYRADTLAAVDPYADPSGGLFSDEAQFACWVAYVRKWGDRPRWAWSWELGKGGDPRSHNLRGRMAAIAALGDGVI